MLSETAMNTDLTPQPPDVLHPMKTNEEKRNAADRRIPLTSSDLMFEVLGNMSGDERHLWFDEDDKCLYTFHNDDGFSPEDETALQGKNSSGNNTHTVGHNGHGINLAIDKLLPDDNEIALASVYSINTKRTCKLGHFKFKVWRNWDNEDEIAVAYILQKLGVESMSGSVFKIPLNDEFIDEYEKDNNNNKEQLLRHHCRKFLNIKIARQDVTFYWNGDKQSVSEICPQKGALTINYTIGYDVKDVKITDLNPIHKKTTILRINSYKELDERVKDIIPEYTNLVQTTKSLVPYDVAHTFEPLETAEMVLNLVKMEKPAPVGAFQANWIDGCLPYINNTCIAYKAITQSLGYNHGVSKDNYGGFKPRFAHHISKNTHHYSVPVDKAHITPTKYIGDRVLRFMNIVAKIAFGISTPSSSTSTPSSPPSTPSSPPATPVATVSRLPAPTRTKAPATSSTISSNVEDSHNTSQEDFSYIIKEQIWKTFVECSKDTKCPICEIWMVPYTGGQNSVEFMHINSKCNDGKNDLRNGIPGCKQCNRSMSKQNYKDYVIRKYGVEKWDSINEKYMIPLDKGITS
jgi:hypothetical protein